MARLSTLLIVAAGVLAAGGAAAQTEADCEAAIRAAQEAASADPMRLEGRSDHFTTMLAEAGEAGIRGEYAKCLEIVKDARGGVGLTSNTD